MHLVQEGDPRAFELLYDRHGGAAFSLAYRMVGNRVTAEDISRRRSSRSGAAGCATRPTAAACAPGCSGSCTTARSTPCGATSCTTSAAQRRGHRGALRGDGAHRRRGGPPRRGRDRARRARGAARRAVAGHRAGLLRRLQPQPDRRHARHADRHRQGPHATRAWTSCARRLRGRRPHERRAPRDPRGERGRLPARRARPTRSTRASRGTWASARSAATRSSGCARRRRPAALGAPRDRPAAAQGLADGGGRGRRREREARGRWAGACSTRLAGACRAGAAPSVGLGDRRGASWSWASPAGFGLSQVTGGDDERTRDGQLRQDPRGQRQRQPGVGRRRQARRRRCACTACPRSRATRTYQVWLQRDGEVIPQVAVQRRRGRRRRAAVDDLDGADAVMVTREPAGGAALAQRAARRHRQL